MTRERLHKSETAELRVSTVSNVLHGSGNINAKRTIPTSEETGEELLREV